MYAARVFKTRRSKRVGKGSDNNLTLQECRTCTEKKNLLIQISNRVSAICL